MGEIKNTYILNLEAKDLWLTNHYEKGVGRGFNIKTKNGKLNLRKFEGSISDSLEWAKIQKVYYGVYRRKDIVTRIRKRDYTTVVANVNFNYSVKEFNLVAYYNGGSPKTRSSAYVKIGYDLEDLHFNDNIAVINDELVGIVTDRPVNTPADKTILGNNFVYADGVYKVRSLRTVVSVENLRHWIYKNGFVCDGKQYRRFKRSNGSSRVGKCLFIDSKLYPLMDKWQRTGIRPEKVGNFDLAAYEAYIGLTLSSIIGTVEIEPKNILIIDDYESVFNEKMIVTRDAKGKLRSQIEDYEVHNKIWDGQSLMDSSLFVGYEERGMLLLRNRFFKSCCFNTNIQQWFADNGVTNVKQLNGYTQAGDISDIKLITTPSSIKYLKFGNTSDWLKRLNKNFGIVKHEKPTHIFGGKLVHTHYQLINTLQMDKNEVEQLITPTKELLQNIYADPAALKKFIGYTVRDDISHKFLSKTELTYNMLSVNDDFCKTRIYEDFKFDLINSIKNDMKHGRILVNGNYSVLCGNPVEMLQAAVGKFDGESQLGIGNIYNRNFDFGKTILASRSPHVCASNIYLATNKYNAEIDKYFNFSKQIVAVNSINESLLDRLSGCDFDSDTCLLTDNEILINAAQRNYDKYLVPTSAVQATKKIRHYTPADLADLDAKTSKNKIGEIINLAQVLTTQFYTNISNGQTFEQNQPLYNDIVTLDILSGVEIDKAKREFEIDVTKELAAIRNKRLEQDENGKTVIPKFLGYIAKRKGYYNPERKNYSYHKSSMEYVQQAVHRIRFNHAKEYLLLSDVLKVEGGEGNDPNYSQRAHIVAMTRRYQATKNSIWKDLHLEDSRKAIRAELVREEFMNEILKLKIKPETMRLLVKTCELPKYKDCKRQLTYLVFELLSENLYQVVINSKRAVTVLETSNEENDTDINIFCEEFYHKSAS